MWANLRGCERAKTGGKTGRFIRYQRVESEAGERDGVAYAPPPRLTASGNAGRVTVSQDWETDLNEGL